ncbi:MAG: DNA double-strand break repair nuclease NurA [Bacillota bacterium]|nr:DNA double-strand break repair nuclease NurA [Bacillota bacterium]
MESLNSKLINKMKDLNNKLDQRLKDLDYFNRSKTREKLKNFGSFIDLEKLDQEALKDFSKMACVDGSVNRFGSSHPHYIDLYQGLAKLSPSSYEDVFESNVYSPLFADQEEKEEDLRGKLLARIEIQAATRALETYQLDYLIMDGNLIRYNIEDKENFLKLLDLCLEKNVIISGFIKEPKTNVLTELIFPSLKDMNLSDKDILYGILSQGEGYILNDSYNKKVDQGFYSIFLRTASYPGVTAMEIPSQQKSQLLKMANLAYSLSPQMSRGVPLIIDMVDKEVKIDDKLMKEIVLAYIDKDLVERFFTSERSMRR